MFGGPKPLQSAEQMIRSIWLPASVTSTDARDRVLDASVCRTDKRNGTGGADVRNTSPTMGHLSWLQRLVQVSDRCEFGKNERTQR